MNEWAVELKDVSKTYRTGPIEVPALRGVTLSIGAGEFAATAGPSGSGKTTLLNIIGGLDRADTGDIWVAGQNLQVLSSGELAHLRLQRIGFVFQTYNLLPVLTALENAEFTLLLAGDAGARAQGKSRETVFGNRSRRSRRSPPSGVVRRSAATSRRRSRDGHRTCADSCR